MLTYAQRRRCLTSAAGDGGVQAGALGDVDLHHLLGAGGVDAHCLQQVGVRGPTPTHTSILLNTASGLEDFSTLLDFVKLTSGLKRSPE